MGTIAFDTLKFAKRLKEGGFTESQAEALAAAEAEFIEENLATKRDVAELKRDMKELEAELKRVCPLLTGHLNLLLPLHIVYTIAGCDLPGRKQSASRT